MTLVHQQCNNKLSTNFSSTPCTVITKHNSTVTVRNNNGCTITRNVSHFKRILNQLNTEPDTDDDTNNNDTDFDNNQQQVGNSQPKRANSEEVHRSSHERKMPERYGRHIIDFACLSFEKGK